MLNYIWAGLIISSLLFAIGFDVADLQNDRYRNGEPLPVMLVFPDGYDAAARQVPVQIRIDPGEFARFYHVTGKPAPSYDGNLVQTKAGVQLRFAAADSSSLPEPLATIARVSRSQQNELQGSLVGFSPPAAPTVPAGAAPPPPGTAPARTTPNATAPARANGPAPGTAAVASRAADACPTRRGPVRSPCPVAGPCRR